MAFFFYSHRTQGGMGWEFLYKIFSYGIKCNKKGVFCISIFIMRQRVDGPPHHSPFLYEKFRMCSTEKNNGIEYAKYTHLNLRVTFLYVPSQTKRSKRMKIIHPLKKFFLYYFILYFILSGILIAAQSYSFSFVYTK